MPPFLIMYRKGDKVRLKKYVERPFGWDKEMMKYGGTEVVIKRIRREENHFYIEDDPRGWVFWFHDIDEVIEKFIPPPRDTTGMILSTDGVIPIAKEVFGEERVFFTDEANVIVIHFPELRITNSKKQSHDIKDLFVKFKFRWINNDDGDDDSVLFVGMTGTRSTFTFAEYYSGYCHSHLPGTCSGWGIFCTGSSAFQIIRSNLQLSASVDDFYMLFYSLEKYLTWESLEGGPHIRMESIRYGGSVSTEALQDELKKIAQDIPIDSIGYNNGIYVMMTDEIYDYFDKHSTIRRNNSIREEDIDKAVRSFNRDICGNRGEYLIFKDAQFPFRIIKGGNEEEEKGRIEKDIVQRYIDIINENGKIFNKKLAYERAKRNQTTFGEVGVI